MRTANFPIESAPSGVVQAGYGYQIAQQEIIDLRRDLKAAQSEVAALKAERARLSARLAHAEAEVSALKAARDAALRLTAWRSAPRKTEQEVTARALDA
jgi:predicted  nucleic acid-binding Zn-ribbon protein